MPSLSLIAKLGLDKTGFDAGMRSAGKDVDKFGSSLKNQLAGAFSVVALAAYTKSIIAAASRMTDLAIQTGISTESLQAMDFAARQSGASVEDIATAMKHLAKARQEALEDPHGEKATAFSNFRIGVDSIRNSRLEDLMGEIGRAMQEAGDSQAYMSDAMELMGRSAEKIIPTLSSSFDTLRESAEKAGQVVSGSTLDAIDAWDDKFSNFLNGVKVKATEVVGVLARLHNRFGLMFDAVGAAIKAPFVKDGFLEAKAALNALNKQKISDVTGEKPFDIRFGQGGARKIPINQFGLWQGPMQPEDDLDQKLRSIRSSAIQSDQFQRIGAFTGSAAQQSQTDLARRQLGVLERLRDDLTRRGILVKGTD